MNDIEKLAWLSHDLHDLSLRMETVKMSGGSIGMILMHLNASKRLLNELYDDIRMKVQKL